VHFAIKIKEASNMKNKFFVMLALISIALIAGCSKGYKSQVNAGGLNIMIKADRYPLVKGHNQLAVIIIGSGQRTITDAKIEARFYMTHVPETEPIGSKTEAVLNGDKYFFTLNPPVEGVWKLDLTVTQPEKQAVTATFNIDVR
jgi:hypothetical protein